MDRRTFRVLAIRAILLGLCIGVAVSMTYAGLASRYDLKQVEDIPERSAVYDMDGNLYSRLAGENRVITDYDGIAPSFVNALLAREDSRFYRHHGVDPVGIGRAMFKNLIHRGVREGGSTLTQQLALNTFLGGQHVHSFHRKLLEAFIAFRIEENFTKKQILAFYANRIYFGSGVYGVETAAQTYFNKRASKLSLGEAAMLAGMIRSPNRYSPFNNLDGAVLQRNSVLKRMGELGMITDAQLTDAQQESPRISKRRPTGSQENYAMDYVRSDLDMILSDEQIDEGGLKIYTTIDPDLQKAAEQSIQKNLEAVEHKEGYSHPTKAQFAPAQDGEDTPYLQGALVAVDNRTGGVRAIVGGRDYLQSRYNRALLTCRQLGSTFKPFVYAAAFGAGLSPNQSIDDGPIRPGEISGAGDWRPANSDGRFTGLQPAAEGLIHSRNTMTVRVGQIAGISKVRAVSQSVGLNNVPERPAIYLGAFEATLKDLTAAYSVFPNGGIRRQSYIIERIDDSDGNVLFRASKVMTAPLSKRVCDQINGILTQVLERGTASAAADLGLKKNAAGKTGTTNDYKDAWFVGYTKTLTCGVWVGLDKPQTIMQRGYGAALALPVWVDLINAAPPSRYPAPAFEAPRFEAPSGPDRNQNWWRAVRKLFGG